MKPLSREIIAKTPCPSVIKHTVNLLTEDVGLTEFSPFCEIQKGIIRNAAPKKLCESGCQLEVGNAFATDLLHGIGVRGLVFIQVQELWHGKNGRDDMPHGVLDGRAVSHFSKREVHQFVDGVGVCRTSERSPHKMLDPGTNLVVISGLGWCRRWDLARNQVQIVQSEEIASRHRIFAGAPE